MIVERPGAYGTSETAWLAVLKLLVERSIFSDLESHLWTGAKALYCFTMRTLSNIVEPFKAYEAWPSVHLTSWIFLTSTFDERQFDVYGFASDLLTSHHAHLW